MYHNHISRKKKSFITIFFLLNLFACSNNKNISDLSRERIFKTDTKYIKRYGSYPSVEDVVVKRNQYSCIYKNGKLSAIGKQKSNIRAGYWYFYDNSLQLDYIINYRGVKQDTLRNPLAMINQKW